jgi:RP/EB family microtubule-associated protein
MYSTVEIPFLTPTLYSDTFTRHQVEKPIPVQQLSKCRMQDNLEFLQWTKRYWDQHYPGGDYDAVGRRKGSGAPAPSATGTRSGASSSAGATRRGATPTTGAVRPRVSAAAGGASTAALQQEIATQKEAIAGLEKERDFYFAKLRDIELLLQNAIEADPELEKEEDSLVKHIQGILYSTEVRVCDALPLFFASGANSLYRKGLRSQRKRRSPMSWRHSRFMAMDVFSLIIPLYH